MAFLKYDKNCKLLMTDTDSLMYEIKESLMYQNFLKYYLLCFYENLLI